MTDMATTYKPERDDSDGMSLLTTVTSPTETPLISEQQLLFSTAAAVALPPARTHRWSDTVHAVAAAVGTWVATAAKPPKPIHPKRRVWLENALMAREMDRL
jgi:hypothetical protein